MALPGVDAFVDLATDFLVTVVLFTVTLHLAATYVLGDVSVSRAVLVAPVPALVLVVGSWLGPTWLATGLAILADYPAIQWSYELRRRLAVGVTLGHVVISVLLVVSLYGLLGSLGL